MSLFLRVMCCAAVCLGAFGQQSDDGETGIRARLEQKGVSFGLSYTAEASTDGAGAQYLGSLASTTLFDLTHLGFGRGQVYVSAQTLHGQGINDRLIGAIQATSNLDEKSFAKFIETWYSDSYLQGRLRIKAGRQYADTEFGAIENAGDFLNASYGVLPTAPMPTYPDPELGVAAWAAVTRRVSLGLGVYRGGGPFRKGVVPGVRRQIPIVPTKHLARRVVATGRESWHVCGSGTQLPRRGRADPGGFRSSGLGVGGA